MYHQSKSASSDEDQISNLNAADLGSILKWSKEISSDINLSLALQKLTEIATGTYHFKHVVRTNSHRDLESSGSQITCVVIARDVGDYTVATSMIPPEPCQVHE